MEAEPFFCCREGKIQLAPLPPLPHGWLEMYQRVAFKTASHRYNALFSFTAIGVSGEEGFIQEPYLSLSVQEVLLFTPQRTHKSS